MRVEFLPFGQEGFPSAAHSGGEDSLSGCKHVPPILSSYGLVARPRLSLFLELSSLPSIWMLRNYPPSLKTQLLSNNQPFVLSPLVIFNSFPVVPLSLGLLPSI